MDKRLQLHGIPKRLVELEKCCTIHNFDVKRCSEIIKVRFQFLYKNTVKYNLYFVHIHCSESEVCPNVAVV